MEVAQAAAAAPSAPGDPFRFEPRPWINAEIKKAWWLLLAEGSAAAATKPHGSDSESPPALTEGTWDSSSGDDDPPGPVPDVVSRVQPKPPRAGFGAVVEAAGFMSGPTLTIDVGYYVNEDGGYLQWDLCRLLAVPAAAGGDGSPGGRP